MGPKRSSAAVGTHLDLRSCTAVGCTLGSSVVFDSVDPSDSVDASLTSMDSVLYTSHYWSELWSLDRALVVLVFVRESSLPSSSVVVCWLSALVADWDETLGFGG